MVIVVETVKGGAGKSTTTLFLGEALARAGRRVLLVDADPQGTLLEWEAAVLEVGEELGVTVEGLPSAVMLRHRLPTLAAGYDVTLVDCPNRDVGIITAALECADRAIVPMPPGVEELRRARSALSLADAAGVPARILVTLADLRTSLVSEVLQVLDDEGVPRFRSVVRRKADIAVSVGAGRPDRLHDYTHVATELEVPLVAA